MSNKKLTIDGIVYIPQPQMANDNLVLIRSKESGAHVGNLKEKNGNEVTLTNARRIWYWDGAASLSQLALDGPSKPENCKFPAPVPEITVLGVCEIIPVTEKAQEQIDKVKPWTK